MLKHTQEIKKLYEEIQKQIYYMIPEKWDSMYLYASVIEDKSKETGELFFYYVPKGILKKKPINVYEIPSKFNIDEQSYLKLVDDLYNKIKELRKEFKKLELDTWSNLTIIIHNLRFMVEYNYENLEESMLSSYERHVIWRCKYLGITIEQLNKKEKEILRKYASGPKLLTRVERYDSGIYIKDIQNTVGFGIQKSQDEEYVETNKPKETKEIDKNAKKQEENKVKNQIISNIDENK